MKLQRKSKKNVDLSKVLFWKKESTGLDKHEKIDVERQWQVGFVVMALIGFMLVGWEVYLFLQIDRNSIFTVVSTDSVKVDTLDRSELESILRHYKEKERAFDRLYGAETAYPQPPEQELNEVADPDETDESGETENVEPEESDIADAAEE